MQAACLFITVSMPSSSITLAALLGYLLPPVALNRILTRQVIGEAEYVLMRDEGTTFWSRHEGTLLPLIVMSTVLVIVSFVPFTMY